ncbi:efflux RND transporter permease subunit [Limisalsivibrio acetivorans]|uniref:efflux RND transporter permease subunit n=1 Tax=Limisalsivibrio acetivorans TaxID=1304888 RepID=UPI0003B5D3B5|nr:efflux RND transporter permease subunit [Limisalsivibrio acetivorans]
MPNNGIKKGPIAWMAGNSVAANLVMLFLLVGGIIVGFDIKQEVFPEFEIDRVTVTVGYPGASPEEVEKGIILPVEEAIQGIDGIDEVTSTASEGSGRVDVEAVKGTDLDQLSTDIKNEVDRITSFPEDANEPSVIIRSRKREVVSVVIYGEQSDMVLRETAEMIKDSLLQSDGITQVELEGEKAFQVKIEIPSEKLKTYGLTIAQIGQKIQNASIDLPAGSIDTSSGEVLVRMQERRDYGDEFAEIPIISGADGSVLTLGEIADIDDSFSEYDMQYRYNGMPSISIEVYRIGNQTPIEVSDAVKEVVEEFRQTLPGGLNIDLMNDRSIIFKQRVDLLLKNGYMGLILVFILLGLFLEARLAFWVTLGIPVSFIGSLLILPSMGASINMVSLFAFIVSLGIVVDDTIVVGENVYSYRQKGYSFREAAVLGAREIAMPVTFSVITNMVTFMPMYFVPGIMGKIFMYIPIVVVSVFAISLIEALFILPAHLAHQRESFCSRPMQWLADRQTSFSNGFSSLVKNVYGPSLKIVLRYRYVSIVLASVILVVTFFYVKTGRMGFSLFPRIESDYAYASATLPYGVPFNETQAVYQKMMDSAEKVISEVGREGQVKGILSLTQGNTTWTMVEMTPPDERKISTSEFIKRWRKATGDIPGLETMQFKSNMGGPGSGAALTVELRHRDVNILEAASAELADGLSFFPIVSDIDDGFANGKEQIDFKLTDEGYRLGFTPQSVAREIRYAYFGYEAITQLRGKNEVDVYVRLPEKERESEYYLEEMLIKSPSGTFVPLKNIVDMERGRAYTSIKRRDGRRVNSVTAEVTPENQTPQVMAKITQDALPALMDKYPGLSYGFSGKQESRQESFQALGKGMILAMIIVYALLAIPFRSYFQPIIIMISIPFGMVGAVAGHLIMGYSMSLTSVFGIVALSGVVVNDSLVLIDFANRQVREGSTPYSAIVNAAISRFRPIMLTTLTTFFGLLPMIFETSLQARFLIPMALSLGFGIVFATGIILGLVPALYMILEDIKKGFRWVFGSPDGA